MKHPHIPTLVLSGLVTFAGAQDNALTASETAAAYDLLFDGTVNSLNANWHGYRTTTVPDAWSVKTNAPLGTRIENGPGNQLQLVSTKKYTNLDLKIEVQTPAGGNSGIFVRYEETAPSPSDRRSGPEMQICGPNHSDCVSAKNGFGACYDMFPVAAAIRTTWYNPPGSWNQMRIIAYDSNYVHYGNGKKLLEYKIGTQEYLTAYNASKYVSDGNNGRYYHIHPGGILLQHHGENGITFRNIKAKALTANPLVREFANGRWPDTLAQGFVFGATVGVTGAPGQDGIGGITAVSAGPRSVRVTVPAGHAGFQALGLDGRAVPFRKISDAAYLIEPDRRNSGIAVIRLRANGRVLSKIVGLP